MFSFQLQSVPAGAIWIPWVLLVLIMALGVALFFLYKTKQDRDEKTTQVIE
jgi:hypothetical protein